VGTAALAAGVARAAVEELAAHMVEVARAEAVLTAEVAVVPTEEAEARVEEAPAPAVLQVGAAAAAIARIKTRMSSCKSGGWPRSRF
jgi:hypothetical protein